MTVSTQDPILTVPHRIIKVTRETPDAYTIDLEPVAGKEAKPFKPGQFNMVYAFGVGEVPISISGNPYDRSKLTHTVRAVGNVTKAICSTGKGGQIGIRGPYGTSWPVDKAEGNDVVIVAGGIGLPPLRAAILHMLENRDRYGKIILLYGSRSPSEIVFQKELEQWRGRFDVTVEVTVDAAPAGWRGNVALVTALIPKAAFDPYHAVAFVVGPEIMMRFTLAELQKRDVENKDIYISMERNMKCGIGLCGHCQLGPYFICKDGPVFCFDDIKEFFEKREI